jgi:hypothetical protein
VQAPRSHRALVEEGKGCLNANPFLENPEPGSQTAPAQPLSIAEVDAAGKLLRALPARRSSRSFVGSEDNRGMRCFADGVSLSAPGTRRGSVAWCVPVAPRLHPRLGPTPHVRARAHHPNVLAAPLRLGTRQRPGRARAKAKLCAGLLVAPQLQRWAVITHSVPIMPPALQLLRRLLTR